MTPAAAIDGRGMIPEIKCDHEGVEKALTNVLALTRIKRLPVLVIHLSAWSLEADPKLVGFNILVSLYLYRQVFECMAVPLYLYRQVFECKSFSFASRFRCVLLSCIFVCTLFRQVPI